VHAQTTHEGSLRPMRASRTYGCIDGRHSGKPYALQRSLLRSSHAGCLPSRRLHEIARSGRRSTISSRSKSCTAFGQGEMHEHQLAICSAYASSGLGEDCLGRNSGRRCLPLAACSRGPRLRRGAKLLVMSCCQCRARQVRPAAGQETCMDRGWGVQRGLSPASRVAGYSRRHLSADPRLLPAQQAFAHRSTTQSCTSRARLLSYSGVE
jgi:hypothetical protein